MIPGRQDGELALWSQAQNLGDTLHSFPRSPTLTLDVQELKHKGFWSPKPHLHPRLLPEMPAEQATISPS